jgi:uncharacterized membrane protein YhaH (DUF805 family)
VSDARLTAHLSSLTNFSSTLNKNRMSTLDAPQMINQSTVSPFPTAVRYGVIGGLILVAYALIGNLTGLTKPSAGFGILIVSGLISIAIYIAVLVMAVRKHRDQDLGGYITFGRAFVVALIASLIASLLSTIFQYVYITVIDPNYMTTMVDEMQVMYERMGLSQEQIDAAMEQAGAAMTPGRIIMQGILGSVIIGAIVSLIVAAIMQRKPKLDSVM